MAKRPRKTRRKNSAQQIERLLGDGKTTTPEPAGPLRHFTPDEHIEWVEKNCYRDVKGKGWQPLRYSGWQADAIRKLFAVTSDGVLRYKTIMPCFTRRCAKTEITATYDLHRVLEYDDQVVVIQANSEEQGGDTVFKQIVDMIRNSPRLAELETAGEITILTDAILFNHTGSIIKTQPSKEASTYGQKISVYHNTELCKAPSDAIYQVGASSTGDAWCGVAFVDSNMGDKSNAVARYVDLAQAAEEEARRAADENRQPNPTIGDPSIGCVYIHFDDLDDVLKRGCGVGLAEGVEPIHPWLDPEWIRGRFAQMTRGEFLRNHCNQPSGAGEVLWSDEQIDPLFLEGLLPVLSGHSLEAAAKMIGGDGRWSIGVGLDRAGAFSKSPDRSVLPVVGKTIIPEMVGKPMPVYDEHGTEVAQEVCDGSVYVLLGAWEFMRTLRDPIQEKITQIDKTWGIGRVALESYQASDLGEWCKSQRFGDRVTVEHMTSQAKQQLVLFMHNLIITRRFFASPTYTVLHAELKNYREDASGGGIPSYGGPRKTVDLDVINPVSGKKLSRRTTWIKDDYLEAVLWAIYAARNARVIGKARTVAKPSAW